MGWGKCLFLFAAAGRGEEVAMSGVSIGPDEYDHTNEAPLDGAVPHAHRTNGAPLGGDQADGYDPDWHPADTDDDPQPDDFDSPELTGERETSAEADPGNFHPDGYARLGGRKRKPSPAAQQPKPGKRTLQQPQPRTAFSAQQRLLILDIWLRSGLPPATSRPWSGCPPTRSTPGASASRSSARPGSPTSSAALPPAPASTRPRAAPS